MAGTNDPPLDEFVWAAPEIAREMGGIHTNTILPYFSQSQFYDATSNNATLTTQALYNQSLYHVVQTRAVFEGRLRTMQGLEFMVTHDPSENDTKRDHNGVWVIRKQTRRKRQGLADEITGISSYFVIGEHVYMAPSIGNILSSRLLSTIVSLTKMLSTASTLSDFTPALGHTYQTLALNNLTPGSSFPATQTSEVSTPLPASGGTPVPTTQDTSSTKYSKTSKPPSSADVQSSQLLASSFDLLLQYGSEYMDENPLLGEPGSFKLSKARESGLATSMNTAKPPLSQPFKSTKKEPPPKLQTDLPPELGRKGTGSAKSPTTPGGKRKKERRKSRAPGAEDDQTPRATSP